MRDNVKIKRHVSSRVMLDAAFFHQMNPNYNQPKIEKSSFYRPGTFDPSAHLQGGNESPVVNVAEGFVRVPSIMD